MRTALKGAAWGSGISELWGSNSWDPVSSGPLTFSDDCASPACSQVTGQLEVVQQQHLPGKGQRGPPGEQAYMFRALSCLQCKTVTDVVSYPTVSCKLTLHWLRGHTAPVEKVPLPPVDPG